MAASRGSDFGNVPRKIYNRLLFAFIYLLCILCICNFCIMEVDWKYNIIINSVGTLQMISLFVSVLETVSFLCFCPAENQGDVVLSTGPRKQGMCSNVGSIFKSCFVLFLSCMVLHVVTIFYGAPFFEKVEETFGFAVLLTTLTTLPCLAILGVGFESWKRVFAERKAHRGAEVCLQFVVVGSLLGAWLGAFPIPLDWDRPWQEWPVTVSIGALWGHTAGLAGATFYLLTSSSTRSGNSKVF